MRNAPIMPRFLLTSILVIASCAGSTSSANEVPGPLKAFMTKHCCGCHGAAAQKADRRFDLMLDQALDLEGLELLEEALDAMNRGDMPPRKKGIVPPTDEALASAINSLTVLLTQMTETQTPASTVLRRLNRYEYVNSIRDLLKINTDSFNPTGDFPGDAKVDGFDNNGEALVLSDYQLRRYIETAEAFVAKASFFGKQQPKSHHFKFEPVDFGGIPRIVKSQVSWRLLVDEGRALDIGHGQPVERHANFPRRFSGTGVPADGYYTITVRAEAMSRLDHPYDRSMFAIDHDQPLKMAIWIAPTAKQLSKTVSEGRVLARVVELADEQPTDYSVRIWMDRGSTPFISWMNGVSSKGTIERVRKRYHANTVEMNAYKADITGENAERDLRARLQSDPGNLLISDVYDGPRLRMHWMTIDGPELPEWPPESHRTLYGAETDVSQVDVPATIKRLARRAFRRPVTDADVGHYAEYYVRRVEGGEPKETVIAHTLAAILSSPRFLYLDEGNDETEEPLDAFQLATRLSYFLWSSVPDEALMHAAASGQLDSLDGLRAQVKRMLLDVRSTAIVDHFTDTWLRLDELGSMPPDSRTFDHYYKDRLESAMRTETRTFFRHVLAENRPLTQFLDCDYTFVNDALAKHYGLPPVNGEAFRKVSLPKSARRGGLLGHASVLTVTANGIETSPVVRGVWILENLLGTPPNPPPPDVEPIEPDTRGTTTIREQLDKHRHVAACADCHKKIDPLGFALEFYDPIGGLRQQYPSRSRVRQPIDGSGQLPSGESFSDERGLKAILLARRDQFATALTEKLMSYGTGRAMTFRDHDAIAKIAANNKAAGYGFADLIVAIALSDTFRRP